MSRTWSAVCQCLHHLLTGHHWSAVQSLLIIHLFLNVCYVSHLLTFIVSRYLSILEILLISSKDWAAQRLLQKHSTDQDFNFLIKQKEREIGNYVLVCLPSSGQSQPFFWPIVKLPSGQYQLSGGSGTEPMKNTMKELIEYYRGKEGDQSLRLNKCVPPSNPSKWLLC